MPLTALFSSTTVDVLCRELSPALSNRFTTVWVPALEDESELQEILTARMASEFELSWQLGVSCRAAQKHTAWSMHVTFYNGPYCHTVLRTSACWECTAPCCAQWAGVTCRAVTIVQAGVAPVVLA